MKTPKFPKVNQKQSFPKLEEEILKFWKEEKIFEESITSREGSEEFAFYDGPPFATGTPHYGHILAGTMKDVIPRYQTMLAKKVDRKFGWDCHGLPIENIVEKKLEISGKEDIEKIGIHTFNETCRENVFGYVDDWKKVVNRMGRWVDMENDYKTMDKDFMESVWSVFKNIYDKGLIYEGNRVVPYCPRCTTPLSNFEVNQGYKDKQDKTLTVKFKIKSNKEDSFYREGCGVIVRNKNGEILLGKKKSNGLLTSTGGKIESGESPIEGAIRELEEESGIKTKDINLFSYNYVFSNGQYWKQYNYIIDVENDIEFGNPEEDKFENWKFYNLENLKENEVESHTYEVIKQLRGEKEIHLFHKNQDKYILAWTTTPWTLLANLGLAVGADIIYSELLDEKNGEIYILASNKISSYYKNENDYKILREYKGSCLVGIEYEPIFDDFYLQLEEMRSDLGNNIELGKNSFKVVLGHHVTTESGVGIVHIAPAFGEDDNIIGKEHNLGFVSHIDDNGKTYNLLENNGIPVFEFNEKVIEILKKEGKIVKIETINHSYPHCWRCDTPLIYRAIGAWYVAVEKIRQQMINNNEKINWTPEAIKHGRFGKWLEGARDWNISRNRYWGSAIPVWQSEDKKEEVCIGSIEQLYNLNKDFGDITKVIFVRHGRTDYNEKGFMDYKGNANLTEIGKQQALYLKEKFKNIEIDAIFSSPLSRCIDTISPLSEEKGLEIQVLNDLIEVNSPDLQDKKFDCKIYKWENGYGSGEKISEVYERVSKALKKLIDENKGKTIVICSHGDPIFLMTKLLTGVDYDTQKYTSGLYLENNPKYGIEKMFSINYVYSKTYKEIDLHKHFVDELFLRNNKSFKAKNVLGIHGRYSDINSDNLKQIVKIFGENGMNLELFQFDKSSDPTYESWENTFKKIDFSKYDAVYTNSFGGVNTVKYLLENNIKVKRLFMSVPGISKRTENGELPNAKKLWESLVGKNLTTIADEIIVIHAKDDEITSFENCKSFAKELGATFIELQNGGHELNKNYQLLAGLVKYGSPLKRIPEVLDCWFESGAMPYASKGLVFENEKNEENLEEIDLHKHFVDELFLRNNKNFKAKNVLGIHGFKRTDAVIDFFEKTGENLKNELVSYLAPVFEIGSDISYKNWEKKLNEINVKNYDTILAHSMGCRVAIEYIAENKININRLILVSPSILGSGRIETTKFYSELKHNFEEIKSLVKEIIVLVSKDDTVVHISEGKGLAKILNANLIELNGYGHFNLKEFKTLEEIIKYGTPLKRIPEVLDCWFESGAMPYASKGLVFENEKTFENEKNLEENKTYAVNICLLPDEETRIKSIELNKLDVKSEYNNNFFKYIPHATIIMKYINKDDILFIKNELEKIDFSGLELEIENYYFKESGGSFWSGVSLKENENLKNLKEKILKITENLKNKQRNKESYAITSFFEENEIPIIEEKTISEKEGIHITFGKNNIKEKFEKINFPKKIKFSKICIGQIGNYGSVRKNLFEIEAKKPEENLIFKNNFYISRHGIAENNDLGIESCDIENQKKYGLTKLGLENTKKEAEKFKNSFDFIVCSPFRRTKETAKEYSKTNGDCKIIIDERLVDLNVGIYNEEPYSESQTFENENDTVNVKYPNGENLKDVEKRMFEVLKEYNQKYEGKNILIVSHGGALQTVIDTLKYGEPRKHIKLIDKSTIFYLNDFKNDETEIKEAKTTEEKEKCFELIKDNWEDYLETIQEYSPYNENILEDLKISFLKNKILFIEKNGEIIAFLNIHKLKEKVNFDEGYTLNENSICLEEMYVKENYKNQGFMTSLINSSIKKAEIEGIKTIYIPFADINKINYYSKFGFSKIFKEFKIQNKKCTYMKKDLSNSFSLDKKNEGKEDSGNFRFPADFIAEGLDQTRGWFYTLLILGTALFDQTPFLNVIVNGIVLAEDGKKMSKSLKNYPDPSYIFDKYGADAMRFYLMNSPVVEAQDLRFSEIGVEEVVKKVILPLWNTYSFFTTYANIDNFEPKKGNLYFIRHAQSESNEKYEKNGGSVSGALDNPKLTKKGIEQAILAGKKLKLSSTKIDIIFTSDLERTIHTANLIAKEIGFTGEIIQNEKLREQNYADFEGKAHKDLAKEYNIDVKDHPALRKIFKNSKVENYQQFDKRINQELENILKENEGKNILIVGHAGVYRPILRKYLNLDLDFAHLISPTVKNAQVVKLPAYPLNNNLDKWIISELHKLIQDFSSGLDNYRLNEATKHVINFMDNLTNWYIRRSRKRFWKSENDMDKTEAYNTLYEVLVELSKIISPFMPFVSEHIYKNLTGKKSVHLDIFPENISSFIQKDLSEDMNKTQKIINLGLAWRANHKIRVRQPLKSITIGEKLSTYYEEIIKEELNIKEIITIDSSKIAKKVCKPNGRLIGPKFGGNVKFIISEAKAGNFEELEDGKVQVGDFILENEEFELAFEVGENSLDIESGFGMVIAMDPEITKELKFEGYARDIVRQIQEGRKEANYNVDDRIKVNIISQNLELKETLKTFLEYIETETLSKVDYNLKSGDLQKEIDFEDFIIQIILKK